MKLLSIGTINKMTVFISNENMLNELFLCISLAAMHIISCYDLKSQG